MKLIKPILDKHSYHLPLAKEIYSFLYENIFRDLYSILHVKSVIREARNSIQGGSATMIYQGVAIHIENAAGSERRGRQWVQIMCHDYGYICGTRAIDGDELDVFMGDNPNAKNFFVVEQVNPITRKFDEYKIMFGFNDINEAKAAYAINYQKGWQGLGHIHGYPMEQFWSWYEVYSPVFELTNEKRNPLIEALTEGKLTYEENRFFKGKVNAAISRQLRQLGARYNKTVKAYEIEPHKLTPEIKSAIAHGRITNQDKVKKINDYLDAIEGRELPELKIELQFKRTIDELNNQFTRTTTKIIPENLEVGMSPHHQQELNILYANDLEKYIKNWHDEAVLRLRSVVMDNTIAGYRFEGLIEGIQRENGINYRKAKFLARQETSLLTSKYREIRYTDNGINYYRWSTSHDERVRRRHRELDGKVFRFDNPPVVDVHAMRRANPGEDFNCRCVAIPIISNRQEVETKMKGLIQNGRPSSRTA